jgi:hypothetical protein
LPAAGYKPGTWVFLAKALKQLPVGLEEIADGVWALHFAHVRLGHVDERDYIIRP